MTNSKHIPKRRFSGFDGEWKEITLYEVVKDFIVPMRDKPKKFSGNIPWTRIDDIEGKYISRSLKGYCVSLETVKSMNLKIIPEDSLIVSASATFGTVAIVKNDLITNQTFIGLVPQNEYEVEFLFYLFQSPKVRNYMKEESAGSTIFYISRESFEKMKIDLPDEKERKLLIKQLCTIDSLVTLHQHKLDKLKNLKKAYLAELFPVEGERVPKRRFPGFEGEWEEKKLGEVSEIYDGTHQTPRYTTDGIMFLSVENIKTLKSNKYISEDDFVKDFKISPQNGDVLMTRIGDIGTSNVVNSDVKLAFYVSLALIRSTQLDSNFLNTSISSINFQKELWSRTLHIAFPKKINKNEIGEVSILFPSITEQQAIGKFFQKLNKSISLQQEKLDKLNDLKKAYLNELFV